MTATLTRPLPSDKDMAQQLINFEPPITNAYQMATWCDQTNTPYPKPKYDLIVQATCWVFNDNSAVYFNNYNRVVRHEPQA